MFASDRVSHRGPPLRLPKENQSFSHEPQELFCAFHQAADSCPFGTGNTILPVQSVATPPYSNHLICVSLNSRRMLDRLSQSG